MDQKEREAHLEAAIEQMEERKKKFLELRDGLRNGKAPEAPTVKDPAKERANYLLRWFQQLFPLRTNCFRCGIDSPIIHVPIGTVAFGDPKAKGYRRGDPDITEDVVLAFEKIGWRFQKGRSYCPTCKKLGSI